MRGAAVKMGARETADDQALLQAAVRSRDAIRPTAPGIGRRLPGSILSKRRRCTSATLALLAILAFAPPAAADEYDSTSSGHPLRILAYVLHPVGVLLDTLIMRPAHWIGSHQPIKSLVGHRD